MTFHESTSGESLLARKGAAIPARLNGAGFGPAEPPFQGTGLAQKPLSDAVAKPASDGAGGKDSTPPASLLAFDFLGARADGGPLLPPKEKAAPRITMRDPDPEPDLAATAHAPAVEPSWRVGVDPLTASHRTDGWTGRMAALALVLGVVAIGWYVANRDQGVMVEKPVAIPAPSEPAAAAQPEPASAPAEPAPAIMPSEPAETPPEAAGPAEPSVDVVRIDPDGSAVIAGRAAPNAELIILDNGAPIGTVTADGFGEWVFIPDSPLPPGAHEFGLVVKSVKGRVSVPAPGEAAQPPPPETSDSEANAAPIPPRKPVPAADTDFTVQLASVKTKAGAEREWLELKRRFPEILDGLKMGLDEAKLRGNGTVIRVRTGGFATLRDAIHLCARLAAKRQECLVIRGPLAN